MASVLPAMSRRRARLSAAATYARVSLAARPGSGALASRSSASGSSSSSNASSAAGKYSRRWCRSRCTYRVRSQVSVWWVLLNLRRYDIDLDLAEVRITGSAAVIAGQRIEGTTKSGRSRTVSIDPGTVRVLRDHRKRQAEERLKVGPEWRGTDDYVFSTAWGEPIHPDTVSPLMTTLTNTRNDQQSEPLPHARLHDLRHVHATTLLLAGVPAHAVGARLGQPVRSGPWTGVPPWPRGNNA
jgi:integrase